MLVIMTWAIFWLLLTLGILAMLVPLAVRVGRARRRFSAQLAESRTVIDELSAVADQLQRAQDELEVPVPPSATPGYLLGSDELTRVRRGRQENLLARDRRRQRRLDTVRERWRRVGLTSGS